SIPANGFVRSALGAGNSADSLRLVEDVVEDHVVDDVAAEERTIRRASNGRPVEVGDALGNAGSVRRTLGVGTDAERGETEAESGSADDELLLHDDSSMWE
ncbi:MAG: hypothetical protein WD225_03000, partial [Ilumatobacteraceae bacterium]